jgi:hypothetical protein
MLAVVSIMRVQGRALNPQQIRCAESARGDLIVAHHHVPELGRYADVATLHASDGGQAPILPPLYDARLAHMGGNGFVLTGLQLQGLLAVAQAWWCRPA